MQFRTECKIDKRGEPLSQRDNILLIGSCFAENIGNRLKTALFNTNINPFGITYNPISTAVILERIISNREFNRSDIFQHEERWHSPLHHSSFSRSTASETLESINGALNSAHSDLKKCKYLLVTFGTAYHYINKSDNSTVSNCHKLPSSHFNREILSVDKIFDIWTSISEKLVKFNPDIRFIFTVSPVRHLKDGLHGNNISKATLQLATDKIVKSLEVNSVASYFPAYELLMDDLRDYRFFDSDMTHPSSQAVDYIWSKFCESQLSDEANTIKLFGKKISNFIEHKPFNANSEQYELDVNRQKERTLDIKKRYPFLNIDFILDRLNAKLK